MLRAHGQQEGGPRTYLVPMGIHGISTTQDLPCMVGSHGWTMVDHGRHLAPWALLGARWEGDLPQSAPPMHAQSPCMDAHMGSRWVVLGHTGCPWESMACAPPRTSHAWWAPMGGPRWFMGDTWHPWALLGARWEGGICLEGLPGIPCASLGWHMCQCVLYNILAQRGFNSSLPNVGLEEPCMAHTYMCDTAIDGRHAGIDHTSLAVRPAGQSVWGQGLHAIRIECVPRELLRKCEVQNMVRCAHPHGSGKGSSAHALS